MGKKFTKLECRICGRCRKRIDKDDDDDDDDNDNNNDDDQDDVVVVTNWNGHESASQSRRV